MDRIIRAMALMVVLAISATDVSAGLISGNEFPVDRGSSRFGAPRSVDVDGTATGRETPRGGDAGNGTGNSGWLVIHARLSSEDDSGGEFEHSANSGAELTREHASNRHRDDAAHHHGGGAGASTSAGSGILAAGSSASAGGGGLGGTGGGGGSGGIDLPLLNGPPASNGPGQLTLGGTDSIANLLGSGSGLESPVDLPSVLFGPLGSDDPSAWLPPAPDFNPILDERLSDAVSAVTPGSELVLPSSAPSPGPDLLPEPSGRPAPSPFEEFVAGPGAPRLEVDASLRSPSFAVTSTNPEPSSLALALCGAACGAAAAWRRRRTNPAHERN